MLLPPSLRHVLLGPAPATPFEPNKGDLANAGNELLYLVGAPSS
jgi:hypothetical protein